MARLPRFFKIFFSLYLRFHPTIPTLISEKQTGNDTVFILCNFQAPQELPPIDDQELIMIP
jgi:hypothetical protein